MSQTDKVMELFAEGLNCSQAILGGFGADHGLPEDLAQGLGRAFGGGMGRSGLMCGALTGAVMVLGLRGQVQGGEEPHLRAHSYARVRELLERFRQMHGSLECRELLGVDISTEQGLGQAKAANLFGTRCADLVRDTARLLEPLL